MNKYITHPKLVKIKNYTFSVSVHCTLSDEEAYKVAVNFCRTHKLTKKHQKGTIHIKASFDRDNIAIL